MKVLFLCEGNPESHDSWSGVSQSVLEHLRAAGHTVIPGDVELHGLSRYLVAARSLSGTRRRWWVRFHLGREGFQARSARSARRLDEDGAGADLILQIGATFQTPRRGKTPLVLYCDSNIELSRAAAASGYSEAAVLKPREIAEIREREARVYREADFIFTMSDQVRQSFIDDFGLPADRLLTVHCGPNVPTDQQHEGPEHQQRLPRVLFVGRELGRKGADLLLEAFPEVRRQVPEARLVMVGGRIKGKEPEWADFLGYLNRDTPEGREAMDRAYRTSSVFCLPTRFDPFGTAFVEAMLYQLPCVGPNAWAVPEIIRHDETGLIVPPNDPPSLAKALVHLLSDPPLAARMGKLGRRRVLEHFTWPVIVSRMLEVMEPLARNGMRAK